ncbi:AMP deaminase 2 isoform X4 [Vespula squamosa]|uniref:AMP deaminase 2 isoform X4 n=1 Tax=Vespula squamosa TaxID=30214 RepID=A0ABD2BDY7_VESSQ
MSSRGVTTTENETFLGIRLPSIFLVDTEEVHKYMIYQKYACRRNKSGGSVLIRTKNSSVNDKQCIFDKSPIVLKYLQQGTIMYETDLTIAQKSRPSKTGTLHKTETS